MLRNRLLLLLAGCLLMASAAWADDVGYVDCSSHPDGSRVYGKARQSEDIVGSVPCGERFTILIYGFIFSRIQTSDNKIGYLYSSLISVDHSMSSVPHSTSARAAVATSSAPATTPAASAPPSNVAAPAQPQPAPAQPAPPPVISTASAAAPAPAATSNVPQSPATAPQPTPATSAEPQPATAQPMPAQVLLAAPATAAPAPEPLTRAPENPPAAQPDPTADPQPQPAVASVRNASVRTSWEHPLPAGRRTSLVEVYGGYSFARFDNGGGTFSNLNGALGAFGVNIKPWLQIVGDTSYNFVTASGTKSVLYGNHFGPRFFYRTRSRWSATPFVEALVGGSRMDTTVSGAGGYKTSDNCLSYKFGGGLDIRPSRRLEIRLIDVDYYRTSFGTNAHQTNIWATTGIVLRLFGGSSAE